MSSPLATPRERGQQGCWASTTVNKSWLGLLESGEGWLTIAASGLAATLLCDLG